MNSKTDFYLNRLRPLIGGTISALARTGQPDEPVDDELFGFVVKLPDGSTKTILLLSDDEGNGSGSFEIIN